MFKLRDTDSFFNFLSVCVCVLSEKNDKRKKIDVRQLCWDMVQSVTCLSKSKQGQVNTVIDVISPTNPPTV